MGATVVGAAVVGAIVVGAIVVVGTAMGAKINANVVVVVVVVVVEVVGAAVVGAAVVGAAVVGAVPVHTTSAVLEVFTPDGLTHVAAHMSVPALAEVYVNVACPAASVTPVPVSSAFGPDPAANVTIVPATGDPPTRTVAVKV